MTIDINYSQDTITSTDYGIELVSGQIAAYNEANGAFNRANIVSGLYNVALVAGNGLTVNTGIVLTVSSNGTFVVAANNATTDAVGVVQLNDTVQSTSTSLAATANSVNTAWAYAQSAFVQANATNTYATSSYGQANIAFNSANNATNVAVAAYIQANVTPFLDTATYTTGRLYYGVNPVSISVMQVSANVVFYAPVMVWSTHTFTGMGFQVTTPAIGGNVKLAIYNSGTNNLPTGAPIFSGSANNTTTNGARTNTQSISLSAGLYWMAFLSNATPTIGASLDAGLAQLTGSTTNVGETLPITSGGNYFSGFVSSPTISYVSTSQLAPMVWLIA